MAVKLKAGILRKLWASHTLKDLVELSKQDYKYRDKRRIGLLNKWVNLKSQELALHGRILHHFQSMCS